MRIARTFRLALAAAAVIPTLALAQASNAPRTFNDSWFWGIKGGSTMFTTGADGNTKVTAPSVGGEWLITRTHIGLYLSVEQSFFDETAGVYDASSVGSVRPVSISDLRRYSGGVYFFPFKTTAVRPYAGLGLAINVIQNAEPQGTYGSAAAQDSVFSAVDDQSSRVSSVFTLGAQAQIVNRVSFFAQASAIPTRRHFLINGSSNTFALEAGLRFNLLGAIDRLH